MQTTSEELARLSDADLKARAFENSSVQLTDQQQALIAWNSRLQTRHSMRTYRRNAIIGFLILLAGLAGTRLADIHALSEHRQAVVESGDAAVIASCNRDFHTALNQRQALYKQPQRDGQRRLTEAEKDKIIKQLTPLPDCRRVKESLTDNPDREVREPKPLHEGLVGKRGRLEAGG